MKSIKIILLVLLLLPVCLSAQSFPYSSGVSEKAIKSLEDVSSSIISDSFSPMTHFSAGDKVISMVPAFFESDRLMKNPDIKGKDFEGKALGIGGGYALTDDIMFYSIFAGMNMKGDLEYEAYGADFGVLSNHGDYTLVSLMGGAGYDLVNNDIFSVPLFAGAQIQYFSAELTSGSVSWTDTVTYNAGMKTSGSGFLFGVSSGIAISVKIYDKIRITPYYLYLQNFNSAGMQSDITLESSSFPLASVKNKYKFDAGPVSAGMAGLNIGFVSETGFSFSVALGSMLSSVVGFGQKSSDNGVVMKSVVFIISYNL